MGLVSKNHWLYWLLRVSRVLFNVNKSVGFYPSKHSSLIHKQREKGNEASLRAMGLEEKREAGSL
jgi:hypothetical protein